MKCKAISILFLLVGINSFASHETCEDYLSKNLHKLPSESFPVGKFSIKEVIRGVFYLTFPEQKDVTSTFIRPQEFYESPEYRGKIFSLKEFIPWYIQSGASSADNNKDPKGTKRFTYYEDWAGFNFPSWVLEPFYEGKFNPLRWKEKEILKALEPYRNRRFYVIATYDDGTARNKETISTVKHELAHSLYYFDADYKKEVLEVLATFDTAPFFKYIGDMGYDESVFLDETNAYIITPGLLKSMEEEGYLKEADYTEVAAKLESLFQIYFQTWKNKPLLTSQALTEAQK